MVFQEIIDSTRTEKFGVFVAMIGFEWTSESNINSSVQYLTW